MSSELEQCPFCKEQDRLYVQKSIGDACWGKCLECGAEGPIAKTEQEAIAAWNTRAERTCKLEEPSTYYPVHLMTCSYCGNETQDANYCSKCGARVVE